MTTVLKIDSSNSALKFIDKRILDNNYRGSWSSQHNRYTMEKIKNILLLFYKYAPKSQLMIIRSTDFSKRIQNTANEQIYAKFCHEAKEITNIGTQDAMRKNIFVDLHRMGLIARYTKEKKLILPCERKAIKYVALTPQALKLINASNILDLFFIFSKAVDQLLGGHINILLELLRNKSYILNKISIYEWMFFVSAVGSKENFGLQTDQCIELIKKYRILTITQKKSVIDTLKLNLQPQNYNGDKTIKRDFHNWCNKAEQMFYILKQTIYFEVNTECDLFLKEKITDKDKVIQTKLKRSSTEKHNYFRQHNVKKKNGFELHHVVPLSWSENQYQFDLFDKWKNMVYIDGYSHAIITQNHNKNILMNSQANDIVLSDYDQSKVYLKKDINIIYSMDKQGCMLTYNKDLQETICYEAE